MQTDFALLLAACLLPGWRRVPPLFVMCPPNLATASRASVAVALGGILSTGTPGPFSAHRLPSEIN